MVPWSWGFGRGGLFGTRGDLEYIEMQELQFGVQKAYSRDAFTIDGPILLLARLDRHL